MRICGIIAEYNPFHRGHSWQIAETRRLLGEDTAIVCAISGNYVQRGEMAILEKYNRAKTAVLGGADLVIELPLAACLSSSEGFAVGGVSSLHAIGCHTLSFGAEHADLPLLQRAAALCESVKLTPDAGASYAASMQQAITAIDPAAGELLSYPNNTLALCYLRMLEKYKMEPLCIPRIGTAHDAKEASGTFASASLLREYLHDGRLQDCRTLMPEQSYAVLSDAVDHGIAPIPALPNTALLARLRRFSVEELSIYCGGRDGLEHRLFNALEKSCTITEAINIAQTRRYPLARIRRALCRVWLDLPVSVDSTAQYLRVLAIGARGREILRNANRNGSLPIITKPLTEKQMDKTLQPALRRDALADDLYTLFCPNAAIRSAGSHFRHTPFVK